MEWTIFRIFVMFLASLILLNFVSVLVNKLTRKESLTPYGRAIDKKMFHDFIFSHLIDCGAVGCCLYVYDFEFFMYIKSMPTLIWCIICLVMCFMYLKFTLITSKKKEVE